MERHTEVAVFPVSEVHFSLYLQHLGETAHSTSAAEEAVNAISWVNQFEGQVPIAQSPLVHATIAGLKGSLHVARPKVKKEPVTVDTLSVLVNSFEVPLSLSELWLAATVAAFWHLLLSCATASWQSSDDVILFF